MLLALDDTISPFVTSSLIAEAPGIGHRALPGVCVSPTLRAQVFVSDLSLQTCEEGLYSFLIQSLDGNWDVRMSLWKVRPSPYVGPKIKGTLIPAM